MGFESLKYIVLFSLKNRRFAIRRPLSVKTGNASLRVCKEAYAAYEKALLVFGKSLKHFLISVLDAAHIAAEADLIQLFIGLGIPETTGIR